MEFLENIAEYYDELFPVSPDQKKFFAEESAAFVKPVKYLRIGCGTGFFEHQLSTEGADVTGIETIPPLLESANRRRRTQLMSIRFFQMSSLEMSRFLGRGFYNIISILNDRLILTHDEVLMKKFFFDCRNLLSDGGKLIFSIPNFEDSAGKSRISLPSQGSIRVRLDSEIVSRDGKWFLAQSIETGNGRIYPVSVDVPVMIITRAEILELARGAGFGTIEFFADFARRPLSSESPSVVAVLS